MTTLKYINNPDWSSVSQTPTPTPTATQAPTDSVHEGGTSATEVVNQNIAQQNKEKRSATPTPTPQTTAKPDNGTSTPQATETPTPTPTIAPVPTTVHEAGISTTESTNQAQAKKNKMNAANAPVTEQRSNEIMANLQTGLQTNPWLFKDVNTFRQAYGYFGKNDNEKALLDNFFNSNKPSPDAYLDSMINGQTVPNDKSPEYMQAKTQYANLQPYLHATDPTQLINGVNTGKLGYGDLTKIQQYNPALYNAYQKKIAVLNKANSLNSTVMGAAWNNAWPNVDIALANISSSATAWIHSGLYDAYRTFLEKDPDVTTAYDSLKKDQQRLDAYNNEKARIRAEIEDSYGDTMTDGAKASLAAKRINDLNAIYGDPESAVTNGISALKTAVSLGGFEYFKEDYANTVMKTDAKMADFESDQEINRLSQADPSIAIPALVEQYQKMGVPIQRSVQELIQEAQADMASGGDFAKYLTSLNKLIQAKPEYETAKKKALGLDVSPTISRIWGTDTNPEYGYIDSNGKLVRIGWGGGTNSGTTGQTWAYDPKTDTTVTIGLNNGKSITMNAEPANALAGVLNKNPDIQIDYQNLYRTQEDQLRLYWQGRTPDQLIKEGIPSLYAQPDKPVVTWTTKSEHMTGSAVDLTGSSISESNLANTIAKMEAAWFYRPKETVAKWDIWHFEYRWNGASTAPMTYDEVAEYLTLKDITGLTKEDKARLVALGNKYEKAEDIAKQTIPEFKTLTKLLSSAWIAQWASNADITRLEWPLSDFIKSGSKQAVLEGIEQQIINAKDKTPLKGIQDYVKIKMYADAITQYAKTKDPNYIKSVMNTLGNKFWVATDLSDYNTFLTKGNLNEVLRIAGTSFTDAFVEKLENMSITSRDTPELVAAKLNGILRDAELQVAGAKTLIWEDVLGKLYPWAFGNIQTNSQALSNTPANWGTVNPSSEDDILADFKNQRK